MPERESDAIAQEPSAAELLRAALEKIVFFEWRVSELAGEAAAAQKRCAAADQARLDAEEQARTFASALRLARRQIAELEAEGARATELLSAPAQVRASADAEALESERLRSAALESELTQARGELARTRAERERWLTQMIGQAQAAGEAPAALAQFISELRGEVIALRDHQKTCEALLRQAGIAVPPLDRGEPPQSPPIPDPATEARRMWAEGRLSAAAQKAPSLPPSPGVPAAVRALAEQALRGVQSADPVRREQAARHLASAPVSAAAPAIATALSMEAEPKARAQLARALAACGGEGAAAIVGRLQGESEPALVRLAALDALCAIPARSRAAIEAAAADPAPAVRRRAAALAVAEGIEDLAARFAADTDATVRAAIAAARTEGAVPATRRAVPAPEVPVAPEAAGARPEPAQPARPANPGSRADPVRAALRRLVLEGGSR